jgi:hypothetical protein
MDEKPPILERRSDDPMYRSMPAVGQTKLASVLTNFVRVPSIPDQLFVYSVANWYDFQKPDGSTGQRVLSRRRELRSVFDELVTQHLNTLLQTISWATDYRVFCIDRLIFNNDTETRIFDLNYDTHDGQRLRPLQVEVKRTKTLSNIKNNLAGRRVEDCLEEITTLNAFIT